LINLGIEGPGKGLSFTLPPGEKGFCPFLMVEGFEGEGFCRGVKEKWVG